MCRSRDKADTSDLHIRAGEFVADEVEALMDTDDLVRSACAEIVRYTRDRNACLIFASGIAHAEHIVRVLKDDHGIECGLVTGETPTRERDLLLFDAPNIDCVALLRPTMSPGLFYQMCGRGFRLHPEKQNCLVLDFGGNVLRHGPVDQIRVSEPDRGTGEAPAKECPECRSLIAAGYTICPDCGHEFPREKSPHDGSASEEAVISREITLRDATVQKVTYWVHTKRDAEEGTPKTMRVEYVLGWRDQISEWICFDHEGWPRKKAESWWRERSQIPVPETVAEAVELARAGALAPTRHVTIQHTEGEKYERIVGYDLGEKPGQVSLDAECPNCGSTETRVGPGKGPHTAREDCAQCGRWLRWIPKDEAQGELVGAIAGIDPDEIPF